LSATTVALNLNSAFALSVPGLTITQRTEVRRQMAGSSQAMTEESP